MDLNILQIILCIVSAMSAVCVISFKRPMNSALALVFTLVSLAGIYLQLDAPFVAVLQVIVYAGAIMVLFIFIIMLLNAKDIAKSKFTLSTFLGVVSAIVIFIIMVNSICNAAFSTFKGQFTLDVVNLHGGNLMLLSMNLFSKFLLPFELVSLALLIAIIGVVALASREKTQ